MILSGQSIRERGIFDPFHERTQAFGLTFGLGPAGYDVRIDTTLILFPGDFCLAATMERVTMPDDLQAVVHDKSTWARKGLSLFNTVIDPGFCGWVTLELKNQGDEKLRIEKGTPIAQMIFHRLDHAAEKPYAGRYHNAPQGATPAKLLEADEQV